ncbi:FG-nucleoporin nsp1 [Xylographa opegraphella]|nr:FG-nucleoporin nsp1 [Xylographa opegraphella]
MTPSEKRPAESAVDTDSKIKRPKLEDAKPSLQPQHPSNPGSTVLISNLPPEFNPWTSITREPRIGVGLLSMVLHDSKGVHPTVALGYKNLTFAEAMLYRSTKSLSDSYGLIVRLDDSAPEDVPAPRDAALPLTSLFGSAPAGNTCTPSVPAPPTGGLFGSLDQPAAAPLLLGSGSSARGSAGLPPAASTSGTRASTFASPSDIFGNGAPSSSCTGNIPSSTFSALSGLFGNSATTPTTVGTNNDGSSTSASITDIFAKGSTSRPPVHKPTNSQPLPPTPHTAFGSGATLTAGKPASTPNIPSKKSPHVLPYPNPLTPSITTTPTTPSLTAPEHEPRPIIHPGQACPRCKTIHLARGVCDCVSAPGKR